MIINDKLKNYIIEIMLVIILFFTLFVPNIDAKVILAVILVIYMGITLFFIKKRKTLSPYSKEVTLLMLTLGIIYVIMFYAMGLYFGFYTSILKFNLWTIVHFIIPFLAIIISSEVIRYVFLSQKIKLTKYITFVAMVLIDLVIYAQRYDITAFDDFMAMVGFILFASISSNSLYNYISCRFGYKPIIIYRVITILYIYIIPITPNIHIFFESIIRIIIPYFIYLIIEYTYLNNQRRSLKEKRLKVFSTVTFVVFTTVLAMLISCQFKYGLIVIGSGSMTGAINKGDIAFFESYSNQKVYEGDILVFERNNTNIIHRVVNIKIVNDKPHYYTKGDANQNIDEEYITDKDIKGIVKFKIPNMGYPSIWIRDIFNK